MVRDVKCLGKRQALAGVDTDVLVVVEVLKDAQLGLPVLACLL